jgi:hypothetical protein
MTKLEGNNTLSRMSSLPTASTLEEMTNADCPLVELVFSKDTVAEYALSVCQN